MEKRKPSIVPDTPRRRSKRLLGRKDDKPCEDLTQDSSENQPQNIPPTPPIDITGGETQATAEDVVANDEEDMDIEQLAMDVFNNMKSMLMSGRSNKETPKEEASGEVMLLNPADKPTKSIKQDLNQLATSLQPDMKEVPYFSFRQADIITSHLNKTRNNFSNDDDEEIISKSVITSDFETRTKAPPMRVTKLEKRKLRKMQADKSAGKQWFDLPATTITPELKSDLRILKMRGALDPSRHYKKNDSKELPKYFQVGTVIEGPGEFYSARVPKKSRQTTIVDELLADDKFRRYNKKKYHQLQGQFQSGTQQYRKMKFKRRFKKKSFLNY